MFEKEKMQVSLLFDTGEGYFAYCAKAMERKADIPEDAMAIS